MPTPNALERLEEEARRWTQTLHHLLDDLDWFDGEVGWDGQQPYVKPWLEQSLRDSLVDPRKQLNALEAQRTAESPPPALSPPEPLPVPAEISLARTALATLVRGMGDTAGAKAVLEQAFAAHAALFDRHGRAYVCPGCKAWGVPLFHVADHGLACDANPDVLRARKAERVLAALAEWMQQGHVRPPELVPPLPRRKVPPLGLAGWKEEAPADGTLWTTREHREALALLVDPSRRGQAGKTVAQCARLVEIALEDWQRYLVLLGKGCRWCGEACDDRALAEHVLHCPLHPERARADTLELKLSRLEHPRTPDFVQVVDKVLNAQVGVARVTDATWAFIHGWSDDIGRAHFSDASEAAWKKVREEQRKKNGLPRARP